ncbi:MAG: dynamin family protein [Symbiobacteriia bacterium]
MTPVRADLQHCLGELERTADRVGEVLSTRRFRDLQSRLTSGTFSLAVLGQFKRGKSSLINALLGADVLPTALVPLTSIVTRVEHAAEPGCLVTFLNGEERPIPLADIGQYATEVANPHNEKRVREIFLRYPALLLTSGLRVIDTPGIGSIYEHNTQETLSFLPNVDAALFVLSVDPPVTKAETDFLQEARDYAGKILFVLNKVDAFDAATVAEAINFSVKALKGAMQREEAEILPLSARRGLDAKRRADLAALEASGVLRLEKRLGEFLQTERQTVLTTAVAKASVAAVRELDFHLRLAEEAIRTPREVLAGKIRIFLEDLGKSEQRRRELLGLVEIETKVVIEGMDEDLQGFEKQAAGEIGERLADYLASLTVPLHRGRPLANKKLRELVEETFSAWALDEAARIRQRFAALTDRLTGRVRDEIQAIRQLAADLFALAAAPPSHDLEFSPDSNLYYVVGDPEPFLPMPDSLTFAALLPRDLALRRLIRVFKDEAASEVSRNCGRVRYDLLTRLEKSAHDLRAALSQLIAAEIDGLRMALEEGGRQQSEGEDAAVQRLEVLSSARAMTARCLARLGAPE